MTRGTAHFIFHGERISSAGEQRQVNVRYGAPRTDMPKAHRHVSKVPATDMRGFSEAIRLIGRVRNASSST